MSSKNAPQVVTVEGPVQGTVDGNIFAFKGIPYAAPPVGPLRWRAPQPVAHWTDPLQAHANGDASLQNWEVCAELGGGDPRPISEDCLYLNVWTPQLGVESQSLPVMVSIYGGGYVIGSGGVPVFIGTPLASRGAVVVTFNYRLGHLGFFAHHALDQEYPEGEVVNNFALLDQIAALEWVQRNIAHFGGNPGNVTIFGQSAGGRSVLSLFASPRAAGLFHKGVAQSVYGLPDVTREEALVRGADFATYHNLQGVGASTEDLRSLDAAGFWAITAPEARFGAPAPISGDSVLPKPLLDVFEEGGQAKLPLIIGNTSDDSSVMGDFGFTPADVIKILKEAGMYDAVKLLYLFIGGGDEELGRQVGRDLLFTTMSFLIAKKHLEAGGPSWRYYFDYVAEDVRDEFPKGARHGDDVAYVMGTGKISAPTDEYFTEQDEEFSRKVSHYWLEFARATTQESTSIEGVDGSVAWPKHSVGSLTNPNKTMGFGKDSGNTIALENNFMASRVNAFEETLKNLGELMPKEAGHIHSYD